VRGNPANTPSLAGPGKRHKAQAVGNERSIAMSQRLTTVVSDKLAAEISAEVARRQGAGVSVFDGD